MIAETASLFQQIKTKTNTIQVRFTYKLPRAVASFDQRENGNETCVTEIHTNFPFLSYLLQLKLN